MNAEAYPKPLTSVRNGLIVSCQAKGEDPFNRPDLLARFAKAAQMAGASGLRACGVENIRAMKPLGLPIIGITKTAYDDGSVLITADFSDIETVLAAGGAIVAMDATDRRRPNGMTGAEFVAASKQRYKDVVIMADCSTREEAVAAEQSGADCVATTLSGYTPSTVGKKTPEPDWDLLDDVVKSVTAPVILEGRVMTPQHARRGLDAGAFAVVVGTAITNPQAMTRAFIEAITAGKCGMDSNANVGGVKHLLKS